MNKQLKESYIELVVKEKSVNLFAICFSTQVLVPLPNFSGFG